MGFKEISDLSADLTVSIGGTNRKTGKKNPNRIEGYYLGKREVNDAKKKSGKSYIYFFQTPDGNVGVWGKTDMDRKMTGVTVGAMAFIEFDKMQATPNGEMYKYRVGVDLDNTIEVDTLPMGATSAGPEGFTDESRGTLIDEDEEVDDDTASAAAAALERKRKLETLLNGGGKGKSTK